MRQLQHGIVLQGFSAATLFADMCVKEKLMFLCKWTLCYSFNYTMANYDNTLYIHLFT